MKSILLLIAANSFEANCKSILMLDGTRKVANFVKGSEKTEKKALRSLRLSLIYNVPPVMRVGYIFERLPR